MAQNRRRPGGPQPALTRTQAVSLGVAGAVVLLLVLAGVWAAIQVSSARNELTAASANATALRDAFEAGDPDRARSVLAALQANTSGARGDLDDPTVSLASHLPWVGDDVDAVRTVTAAVDDVAQDALPPLVDVAGQFTASSFSPKDGAIDVAAVQAVAEPVAQAGSVLQDASARAATVDTDSLMGLVRGGVADVQDALGDAARLTDRAETAAEVLPTLLGAGGEKRYLLLFQNNAEVRATGGLPGAWAEVTVRNGRIELGEQGAGGDMGDLPYRATRISAEERELFTPKLVSDFRDVNFTPDFPRAAQIAQAIVRREKGLRFDGVLAIDPVTLSYVLRGTGPVTLDDGSQLTSDNAVSNLLNGVYVTYPDNASQDAYFASATRRIFESVTGGGADAVELLRGLADAAQERRVLLWTSDEDVQATLAERTPLTGALPTDADEPHVGLYLNDATGAKMQYYLGYETGLKATACSEDGVQTYEATARLSSSAPADAETLPESIRGPGFGALPGTMLMNLYVYAPAGGTVEKVAVDGDDEITWFDFQHRGRGVGVVTVMLEPGQSQEVTVTLASGADAQGDTVVDRTPSIAAGTAAHTTVRSACS